jgi:hypothetical protein
LLSLKFLRGIHDANADISGMEQDALVPNSFLEIPQARRLVLFLFGSAFLAAW